MQAIATKLVVVAQFVKKWEPNEKDIVFLCMEKNRVGVPNSERVLIRNTLAIGVNKSNF